MNIDIFLALAKAMGRPDLIGPLALGWVATDLFAFALGLKRPSSLFKKLEERPELYPLLHRLEGSRRQYFLMAEIEVWHATASMPVAVRSVGDSGNTVRQPQKLLKKAGRPPKHEQREALRRGISVKELRSLAVEKRL
jgi:hypothetical protein